MISIVIVTYNAVNTLQKCLDSIYSQSSPGIQIILIDGESTDGTQEIVLKNKEKLSYVISEPDAGIYDAMNKALERINTPWVYFLGADDILLPDFSTFLSVLTQPNFIYYADVHYKGAVHSGDVKPYRQAKSGIFHQSIIYPSAIFKHYKYNTRYAIAADYALNMQLYKDPKYTFKHFDYTIAHYNDTGISADHKDANFEADKSRLIRENFGFTIWLRYQFRMFKSKRSKQK